jgi:hypothetical protein
MMRDSAVLIHVPPNDTWANSRPLAISSVTARSDQHEDECSWTAAPDSEDSHRPQDFHKLLHILLQRVCSIDFSLVMRPPSPSRLSGTAFSREDFVLEFHVILPFPFNLEVTSLYSKINCRPLRLPHVRVSFHRGTRVSQ